MACYKNFGAFTIYGFAWMGIFMLSLLIITVLAALLGSPAFAGVAMLPAALVMFAMFFTSIYFTFRDSFEQASDDELLANPSTPAGMP